MAASLALHGAVLGALPGGESGGVAVGRLPATLVVQLETPPAPAPARQVAPARAPGIVPKRYYGAAEVDERAAPTDMAVLVYPEKAYLNRIRGTVRVRVYINDAGRVDKAEIVAATPGGHFEQAALEAVQRSRFAPARKDGRPVPSQKLIEVEFDPYGPTPEEPGKS